jgi:hypothetical protein
MASSTWSFFRFIPHAFFSRIVTGDETWMSFVNAETDEWMHTYLSNKPELCKQMLPTRKLMATVL